MLARCQYSSTVLSCTPVHSTLLHCTTLHRCTLCGNKLYGTSMLLNALHCSALHCSKMIFTALHCLSRFTALHSTVLPFTDKQVVTTKGFKPSLSRQSDQTRKIGRGFKNIFARGVFFIYFCGQFFFFGDSPTIFFFWGGRDHTHGHGDSMTKSAQVLWADFPQKKVLQQFNLRFTFTLYMNFFYKVIKCR